MLEKHLLVLGASRGIGCTTANYLRSSGHTVYTAQRTPQIQALTDEGTDKGFWAALDFQDPSQAVDLVQKFVADEIKLDGILCCTSYAEPKPKYLYNLFDFQHHLTANVIGPLMLLIYLEHHGVLKFAAPVVFVLDDRRIGSEYLAYGASRKALRPMVEAAHKTFPLHSDLLFAPLPENQELGADSFTEAMLKVFTEGHAGMGRVLDTK